MKLSRLLVCVLGLVLVSGATLPALAQEADAPRPIAALDSVWMEQLTWMEIRDAIASGKTTAFILTGGVEANGPYVPTGKHNYILEAAGEAMARKLGNALIVPILRYEPGSPATSSSPGTVVLSDTTYKAVLTDMATSLKAQGFKDIVLMGDSGGNQSRMQEVTEKLSAEWGSEPTAIHFVPEYYATKRIIDEEAIPAMGIVEEPEGLHDSYRITSVLLAAHGPEKIRFDQRVAAGKASINGININPPDKTIEIGKKNLELRVDHAVAAILKAIGRRSSDQRN
jgi:creatinine amidohydrolase